MHRKIVGFTQCTCLCQCTNSPLVLPVLNSFWMRVAGVASCWLYRVEKREEEEEETEKDDIYSRIYVLLCPANGKTPVCAAVLFLSRSSNVLPIGSANPSDFFSNFKHTYYVYVE